MISNPATDNALIADSRPDPGPFTCTSIVCIPIEMASFPAFSAANVAAKAVLFLDPLNPLVPAVDHARTFPNLSVKVI